MIFVKGLNRNKNGDKGNFIETLNQNIDKILMKKANEKGVAKIEGKIDELKQELKVLIQLQLKGQMDVEVYQEEQTRIGAEFEGLREQKREMGKEQDTKEQDKKRVQEIIEVFKQKEGLLEQIDDGIFNALVEKIEILSPTHFVFVLKSEMRMEKNILY